MRASINLITPQGKEKPEAELHYLRSVRRWQVAQRLHEATEDGDLEENAEYEAAKAEQAFIEGRIRDLEEILARSRVAAVGEPSPLIRIGSTVIVQEGDKEPESYTIGGTAESNPRMGMISYQSPLGRALLDRQVGDLVEVIAPAGSRFFKILRLE